MSEDIINYIFLQGNCPGIEQLVKHEPVLFPVAEKRRECSGCECEDNFYCKGFGIIKEITKTINPESEFLIHDEMRIKVTCLRGYIHYIAIPCILSEEKIKEDYPSITIRRRYVPVKKIEVEEWELKKNERNNICRHTKG